MILFHLLINLSQVSTKGRGIRINPSGWQMPENYFVQTFLDTTYCSKPHIDVRSPSGSWCGREGAGSSRMESPRRRDEPTNPRAKPANPRVEPSNPRVEPTNPRAEPANSWVEPVRTQVKVEERPAAWWTSTWGRLWGAQSWDRPPSWWILKPDCFLDQPQLFWVECLQNWPTPHFCGLCGCTVANFSSLKNWWRWE